ncbi:MAG: hypothetical protein JWO96_720 [Candidatus Saccharibacteria bacterium]|nr:hypothetical protein [Candidatus Saccharibacteria bacterium]
MKLIESGANRLHRSLSRRGAMVVIRNASSEEYGYPPSKMDHVYFASAKLLERHVTIERDSNEVFQDVHKEATEALSRQAPSMPQLN